MYSGKLNGLIECVIEQVLTADRGKLIINAS